MIKKKDVNEDIKKDNIVNDDNENLKNNEYIKKKDSEEIDKEDINENDFSEDGNLEVDQKSQEQVLQEKVEQLRDEKLRLLAEMENLRKRADRDKIDSIRYGSINLARDILSPDDNLTRALEAIPQEEKNSKTISNLIDGLQMVQKEFSAVLKKYGVKKIEALNKKFDHNFHQAMVEIENDEIEHGTVIQEMQSGYIMHERLLRPSMVGVSKKPVKKEKNQEKS